MGRWKHVWSAAGGGAAVVAVWAVVALTAPAQHLAPPAQVDFRNLPEPKPKEPEVLPPLVVPENEIEQAQFQQRASGGPGQPTRPGMTVPDPAHPVVIIRVRVPADVNQGEEVKYVITVQNVSSADAHSVTVRNPLPAEAEFVRAEPKENERTEKQLVWALGTLKGGQSRALELTLRPKEGVKELKNLAYVKYEHGQAVTTKIGKPTVRVAKTAPKQTVRDQPYTVRVLVENQGKVPAEGVRVVENLPPSAEVEPITAGARKITQREGQQWEWTIARLQPGERKVFEYRVTPRQGDEVFTLTSVAGSKLIPDRAEARTQVLVPGLEVKLTGPPAGTVVNPGESAKYEIVVRNTGTLPSTNLKVTGTIPADCKPTRRTDGGQLFRDSVVWQVPRLEPGEAQSFRYEVKASTTGRRVLVASVSDARGTRHSQELATVFAGVAALVWETTFDAYEVQVGRRGMLTVRVKNDGGEDAKNVRLQMDVPDNVSVIETTPKGGRVDGNLLAFPAETVRGYGNVTYTITFEGKQAGQARFRTRLAADYLGDRPPMQTEKVVEVIGGPK